MERDSLPLLICIGVGAVFATIWVGKEIRELSRQAAGQRIAARNGHCFDA
jgi:hypothetical protein